MSFVLLGILNSQALAGGGGGPYWLSTLGGSASDECYGGGVDSMSNVYLNGTTKSTGNGGGDMLLAKYDFEGTVQWQRNLNGTNDRAGYAAAVDSSDNAFAFGWDRSGSYRYALIKYNSAGTLQWQVFLGGGDEYGEAITTDSSDNVYVQGFTEAFGGRQFFFAKYNSAGTLQWQRALGTTTTNSFGEGIAVDATGNVYVTGGSQIDGGGLYGLMVAKYNSAGTLQWQRKLNGTGNDFSTDIALDSSGNVYLSGYSNGPGQGGNDLIVAKYNSSGTLQWQKRMGGSGADVGHGVATDSSDNVYVVGHTASTGQGGYDLLITKYDSTGSLQFQRVLGATSGEYGEGIAIDSNDDIHVFGYTTSTGAGGDDYFVAKLPSDGSLTGTYNLDGVNFTYAASSLTGSTPTFTNITTSAISSTTSLSAVTSTLTSSSASLTRHFVEIGA
tara:strand:+ start:166 stop:1494 length:1329 start_codon:yes stop_codon:yes gene_type:complete